MLDPLTLLVALVVTHFIGTIILIIVWQFNRSLPGVGWWSVGRVCVLIGLIVFSFRQISPLTPSVLLGNALLFVGMFFVWRGNLAFMERATPRLTPFALFFGVVMAGMIYWTMVESNFAARIALSSLVILAFDWLSMRALWPRKDEEVYFFGKLMAITFALSGVLQVARMGISLWGRSGESLLEPSFAIQVTLVGGLAMSMASAMAFMAMIMEHLKKDLKRQAERDPLTGVYNRRAFDTVAGHVMARGRRTGHAVSLVILDLDHFKAVNDSHGHVAGDMVLKRVADLVQGVLRAQDVLVRLGGEEFAMMLPATTVTEASHVAERIRKAVEAEVFQIGESALRVTTSLGVMSVAAMNEEHHIDDLIRQADMALYRAKDEGRNRVCVAT
ncbi:GGDEF domain-containing protein [Magnetovibrio sp.]|uniref:GGDEF domain-containing protein n=1 Tax=Magnetovibrio sp. TaxID=2024836 RepID=UPI002F93DD9B